MQPTFRHVPPKTPCSTSATSRWANRSSTIELPEPVPLTASAWCRTNHTLRARPGEVMPVHWGRPAPAPLPADALERGDDRPAVLDHAGQVALAIQVGGGELGQHEVALAVGVLERVDVHGEAER